MYLTRCKNCEYYIMFNLIVFSLLLRMNCVFADLSSEPITDEQLKTTLKSEKHVLVLFCEKEVDSHCLQVDQRIQHAVKTGTVAGVKSVVVLESSYAKEFQLRALPQLVYFRDENPILYYADHTNNVDLGEWVARNQEVSVKHLNEDNFEHDTQASTGATTGDWFIMFYDTAQCSWLIPTWDALASRLKQRLVVGAVDIGANKKLKERFKLQQCMTLIFFRLGSMYEYDLKAKDIPSLASFAEGWFKNVAAVKVPVEPTPFDKLTDNIASTLRDDKNRNLMIGIAGSAVVLGFIIIFCSVMAKDKSDTKIE